MARMLSIVTICYLIPTAFVPSFPKQQQDPLIDIRALLDRLMEFSARNALASAEAKGIYTDEALEWDFATFGKLTEFPDKTVLVDRNNAIARYQLSSDNGLIVDVYIYMTKQGAWKIKSVRRLALTGGLEAVQFALKARTDSTKQERDLLANIELTLATDKMLRTWLVTNKTLVEQLRDLSLSVSAPKSRLITDDNNGFPGITSLLRQLHLRGVATKENGNVEIVIGGVLDNTVGYIYSPTERPPKMDDTNYFWIEKVMDKWYLFRTT